MRKAATTLMWEQQVEYSIEGMEVGRRSKQKNLLLGCEWVSNRVLLGVMREWLAWF